jgi:hypothetical protein
MKITSLHPVCPGGEKSIQEKRRKFTIWDTQTVPIVLYYDEK